MNTPTQKTSAKTWAGPAVLGAPPGRIVVAFWLLLGALYLIPGPARDLLRSDIGVTMPSIASVPAIATPPPPPLRRGRREVSSPPPGGALAAAGILATTGGEIEDPHHSLAHFAHALRELTAGRRQHVRVLHYGDSQLDIDHITASLRRRYQGRYGDGGLGFVPVAKPWRWFYQPGVVHRRSPGWQILRVAGGPLPDGRLGLGLAAAERLSARGWVRVIYGARASHVELTYLRQPSGGSLILKVAKKQAKRVSTASSHFSLGTLTFDDLAGKRQIVQVSTHGRVRLLGLRFERPKGLTWEGLPMISARFHRLSIVDSALWKAELRHVAPSLVLYQFGANDALSYGGNSKRYEARVARVLRWRGEALPQAACLVIGPLDQLRRRRGHLEPRPAVSTVIAAQRAAARQEGCAFWDARQAMGGAGSLKRWIARKLLRHDLIHLNRRGAEAFVRLFDSALQRALLSSASQKTSSSGT